MNMRKWLLSLSVAALGMSISLPAYAAESKTDSNVTSFETTSLVKTEGTFWNWGDTKPVPTQVVALSDVDRIISDNFIQKKDGTVWFYQPTYRWSPNKEKLFQLEGVRDLVDIVGGSLFYVAVGKEGHLYIIQTKNAEETSVKPSALLDEVAAVSYYDQTIPRLEPPFEDYKVEGKWLFLRKDGTVWQNEGGKLDKVKQVPGLPKVKSLSNELALAADGTVWRFPTQVAAGQSTAPAKWKGISNIQKIYYNGVTTLAIDANAKLWFLGGTVTGVSDGTQYHEGTPVQIKSINKVKDAFVVERSLIVWTTDNKVYSTSIENKQMSANPKFELLASDVVQIAPSSRHFFMEKKDGSLWGWGVNKNAELGYGDYEFMHTKPVPLQKPITVNLNGETPQLTSGAMIRNGQAFVPLRSIFSKLGAEIGWDDNTKTATVVQKKDGEDSLMITIDMKTGTTKLDGKPVELQNAPFTVAGTAYLPLRFISESLGAKVDWQQANNHISITMK
ncbi:stalk domain-containing protein [Paenibacillus sp. 1001270B_150601_E10]|uniref:stalk domain-containing protein n=1 Tax=Paenibacillus sp. 1001270B_150601_E10 TaxID=2787079 RepID=UPI00189C809B|nr:stalk domain-containing protein [Paenibacillus sp. 1001270B_150601_E10]